MKKYERPVINISMFDMDTVLTSSGSTANRVEGGNYTGTANSDGKDLNVTNLFKYIW